MRELESGAGHAIMLLTEPRPLDVVGLATARRPGEDLEAIIIYDERMAEAATHLGHRVLASR